MKKCRLCKKLKLLNKYSIRDKTKLTYRTECKACLIETRKLQPRYGMWHKENKKRIQKWTLNYSLERNYGITKKDYDEMLKFQKNKCAICGTKKFMGIGKRAHVDHCHDTGKVRGLLCNLCNVGLGAFLESKKALKKSIDYLSKNGVKYNKKYGKSR